MKTHQPHGSCSAGLIATRPVSEQGTLEGFEVSAADLTWGNGRYALLTTGPLHGAGAGYLTILDSTGAPRLVTAIPQHD